MLIINEYVLQEASSWDVLLPEAAQDIDQEFALRYGIEPIYRIMTYVNHVIVIVFIISWLLYFVDILLA